METTVKLYSLGYANTKTYLFALLFATGNLLLPRLCHLVPDGGLILQPLYFFTLVAAYKYGWQVGLLTAVLSPVANMLLFGMPPMAILPLIVIKSSILAMAAALAARWSGKVTLLPVALAVLASQGIGLVIEGAWHSFPAAANASRVAIPGILLQIFGGYALLKAASRS